MNAKRSSGDLRLYWRLLRQARPFWPHIAGLLVLSTLTVPLALVTPLPLKIVVDSAIGAHPLPAGVAWMIADSPSSTSVLLLAVALIVAFAVAAFLRGFAASILDTYTGESLVLRFRALLFHRVQRLSFSYHDRMGVTDSVYRIQYDALSIQWIAVQGVIPFVTAAFMLIGMVYVIARLDVHLALVALAIAPILFLLTRVFRRRLRRAWSSIKKVESSAMSAVQESLAALRVVKSFGQEHREEERLVSRAETALRGRVRLAFVNGGFDGLIGITIAAGTAATLFIGVRHVEAGVLTLGNLLLIMAYLAQLYGPLQTINRKVADLQAALASADRAFAVLDEAPDVVDRPDAVRLSRARGAVEFRDVCFAYPGGDERVLHDVSFYIAAGTRVGIAGPTGAGKTTLVSLLTRFYDPTAGRILLDGRDLRAYKLADVRNQFAIVPQEPVLFSTSIAENIAYARPGASEEEIREAARLANAHDFITRLPAGYRTVVGERGMLLSGGERQRIALARAFLKDAPLLILDEPTSSVDPATEAAILESMNELMRDRTSFMIAHRPSTLEDVDVLLRIEAGRLTLLAGAGRAIAPGRWHDRHADENGAAAAAPVGTAPPVAASASRTHLET